MTPEEMATIHAASFTTPRPWSVAEFAGFLADPTVFSVTRPDGFALGRAVAGEAELLTIAVAPEARQKGTGRALMRDWALIAAERGAMVAFLEVAADNAAARRLYAGEGFTEAGHRRGYYRRPDGSRIDAVVMTAPLGRG